jgi:hypothetical protein
MSALIATTMRFYAEFESWETSATDTRQHERLDRLAEQILGFAVTTREEVAVVTRLLAFIIDHRLQDDDIIKRFIQKLSQSVGPVFRRQPIALRRKVG